MWKSLHNNYTTNMVYVLSTQKQSFDTKMKSLTQPKINLNCATYWL